MLITAHLFFFMICAKILTETPCPCLLFKLDTLKKKFKQPPNFRNGFQANIHSVDNLLGAPVQQLDNVNT